MVKVLAALVSLLCLAGCIGEEDKRADGGDGRRAHLEDVRTRLKPLHTKMGKPRPGDWLAEHHEDGQTFAEYLDEGPTTASGRRKVIYIQPLGPFTRTQRKIVDLSAEFMGIYFGLPVKIKKDLALSIIPRKAQRDHPRWKVHQLLSTYILDDVLRPRLPRDAAAYIAFTAVDLYPEPSWNFVFGQASLRYRVGVWSIYRNGDPDKGKAAFRLCLLRTLKTATHETGHMFSMEHCILYECNMCGSNNRPESDRRTIALCPECLPKLLWATGVDELKRFEKLAAFCRKHGLEEERAFYTRSLTALKK